MANLLWLICRVYIILTLDHSLIKTTGAPPLAQRCPGFNDVSNIHDADSPCHHLYLLHLISSFHVGFLPYMKIPTR